MPITVAALITQVALRHLRLPAGVTHVIVPGYCELGLDALEEFEIPIVKGPEDCREIPRLFGEQSSVKDLTAHTIEIISEINHVPRKSIKKSSESPKK